MGFPASDVVPASNRHTAPAHTTY
ncbi:hypothetical protein PENDEC_c014G06911 [Penicillium decumbens]|uniref:Uncharacterized protein n=1 Tax=Penicillium decumbens TaxID=69771 RepID=A0A1V6PA84_PENDC|nr:hypothetical protein PENDEC_c014G06911 [Penicillium decumbens]